MRRLAIGLVLSGLAALGVSARSEAAPASSSFEASMFFAPAPQLNLLPPVANDPSPFAALDVKPTTSACGDEMVEVEGEYCPYVFQHCIRWLDPTTQLQCAEFAPVTKRCLLHSTHKKFCIDKFEWPNKKGALPVYMTSWNEAKAACEGAGKRLCSDSEWTLACEGPEHLPYPYGHKRDKSACNIDKPHPEPVPERVYDPRTQAAELARLDQREPSGAREACVSAYGVHDMAGNVDEWVVNETQNGWPHQSGLKGGYWGPVRTRCRPMTTAHGETFRYYQIGFRCCK